MVQLNFRSKMRSVQNRLTKLPRGLRNKQFEEDVSYILNEIKHYSDGTDLNPHVGWLIDKLDKMIDNQYKRNKNE